jgi:hypothetical protein
MPTLEKMNLISEFDIVIWDGKSASFNDRSQK